jgi:hypothetical protein
VVSFSGSAKAIRPNPAFQLTPCGTAELLFRALSMREHLFDIAALFEIEGQGLVLASDRGIHQIPQIVEIGQLLEFCPTGERPFRAKVTSMQHPRPFSPYKPLGFCVEPFVQKAQVPIGTSVWLVHDEVV